jgi:hypothetical protein
MWMQVRRLNTGKLPKVPRGEESDVAAPDKWAIAIERERRHELQGYRTLRSTRSAERSRRTESRLSEFIRANGDQIVHEWEEFAKTLSAGTALPRWILRDHAPAIVKHIADDMEVPQAPAEEEAKSKGEQPSGLTEHAAAVHLRLRIESGFDLV